MFGEWNREGKMWMDTKSNSRRYGISIALFFVLFSSFSVNYATEDSSSSVCTGDCLQQFDEQLRSSKCPELQSKIYVGYIPKGNTTAGDYSRYEKGDNSTEECARHCCSISECHLVLIVDSMCFTLNCNNGSEQCVPMKIPPEKKLNVSVKLVLVRNPSRSTESKDVPPNADNVPMTTGPGGECEVGAQACPENENCVSANTRSRNGKCQCKSDFIRNPEGQCVPPGDMALPPSDSEEQTTQVPPVASSTKKTIRPLKVTADNKNVTLPDNEVALYAYVMPPDTPENQYQYEWRLISNPTEDTSEGTKEGQMTRRLHLMGLKQGTYVFQVTVKGTDTYGTANATVNVFPQNRTNLPPVAVISPPIQTVKLPTASVVLDAGSSTDDEKIISYKWELQKGPIEYTFNPLKSGVSNSTTLQVENLIPGNYTFKLTVEDGGHLTNSTTANITVIKETDYPPTAIAGQDVVIHLPTNEVTLNGNGSTDDKRIVSWEWKATGESNKAADMQDTRTPYLKLSNLQEGMYQYELKVTDEAGQSSTSTVHVFVKKPSGNPPTASAGPDVSVSLPQTWATVDASGSKADTKIVKWTWIQLKGPTNATILQKDQVLANVTGLTKGDYEFQVEVEDDAKLTAKSSVKVTVMQKTNEPPVAHAGGVKTVELPKSIVLLNGSQSKDDVTIKEWKWEREPESSAAGVILGDSDTTAILELSELLPGKYVFRLTVKDEQGLSAEDTATLIVKEDPRKKDLIEIVVDVKLENLTEADLEKFLQQLSLLLHDTHLVLERMQSQLNTENAILILHGETEKNEIVNGPKLAKDLRHQLRQDVSLLQLQVVSIDTVLCLDACSGHGVCVDSATVGRQCVCHAFWMENFLKKRFGNGERNCEWSKIYVGVVTSLLFGMIAALFWSLLFLYRKNLGSLKANLSSKLPSSSSASGGGMNGSARMNGRKHHHHHHYSKKQYTLLDDDEIELESKDDDEAEFEDSDDSDVDVLFETSSQKSRPGSRQKNNLYSKKFPSSASSGSLMNGHRNNNGILKNNPRRLKT